MVKPMARTPKGKTAAAVYGGPASARSKRDAILSVAVEVFAREGYEQAKWALVAEKVGIGSTALYHYFESKAHCLLTIIALELERDRDNFVRLTQDDNDPQSSLLRVLEAHFDVSREEALKLRVLTSNFPIIAEARSGAREEETRRYARDLVRQIEDLWTEFIVKGIADGAFAEQDPHLAALAMLGLIRSVWFWFRSGGSVSTQALKDFYTKACLRVISVG